MQEVIDISKKIGDKVPVVFLPNYNIQLSYVLIPGVDVWLNTPLRPLEASGTSGMKAAHNGVINFSILDGWWYEGCIEDVNGWTIGPKDITDIPTDELSRLELEDFYKKLESKILPLFDRHQNLLLR